MAGGDSATVELDGHRLNLTHLRKVLYPATGTTKSEIIGYFAEVAHVMIPHLAGRPVTRKRWPDGVSTAPFFHKNLDRGTPSWVSRRVIEHSDGPKAYPVVDSPATLAWLGQIAALELHVPQWRFELGRFDLRLEQPGAEPDSGFGRPDRLVFDLDPGPGVGLAECAEVARAVRRRLSGSVVVPVTSGSKGIHLYSRLDGTMSSDDASLFAKQTAEAIEKDMPELVVSRMLKSLRPGKVFIDWSQNNASKTTIAPYSLRGREHPTVAAPRTWDELEDPGLRHLEYTEVLALLADAPDPMQGLETGECDGAEHRGRKGSGKRRGGARTSSAGRSDPPDQDALNGSKLDTYRAKRSADRTPEPVPESGPLPQGNDDTFVIQEHHARRLHYDFRLERDGVLVSWAVPKGLPTDSGQNRLAVHTEDHPLDYADFAGTIPQGEYGGGTVTIWDAGTYVTEKWRDDEVIVILEGKRARGRYALIRTKDSSWLMHRTKSQQSQQTQQPEQIQQPPPVDDETAGEGPTDEPRRQDRPAARRDLPAPPSDLRPMLAATGTPKDISSDHLWRFEGKWDGIRAVATVGPRGLTLHSRAGNDFTRSYPEVAELADLLEGHSAVLDGEIVVLDDHGVTSFSRLQQRMNLAGARDIARMRHEMPVQFWLFDVLWLDGVSLLRKKYDDRRRILQALPLSGEVCHVPEQLDGSVDDALRGSVDRKWEGIVAKRADSQYVPGRRSRTWFKMKNFRTREVVVVGWRPGAGRRAGSLGSLLVAVPDDGGLRYAGKVGTGFTDAVLDQLMAALHPLQRKTSAVVDSVPREDSADAVWVEPTLVGEVRFADWTSERRLRAASWRGLRPDKAVTDINAAE